MAAVNLTAQENQNRKSKLGLIFSLRGLDNILLDEYQGGIGFKYFVSEKVAIRNVFDLEVEDSDRNAKLSKSRTNRFGIQIRPGVEYHFLKRKLASPYVGGEFIFERQSIDAKTQTIPTNTRGKQESDTTIFGGSLFLGFEFYPFKFLSFAGEYLIAVQSISRETKSTLNDGTSSKNKTDTTIFEGDTLGFIALTIYF